MRLATWNVQGLRTKETEVFQELKRQKIDICVLTETKKKGKGNETKDDYIHIYSGVEKSARAKRGVSIAIHKKLKKYIKRWEEIDEQIITMDLERNGATVVIIGAYAPSDDADVKVKDEFYDRLRDVLINVSHSKEICLCGDFNARVGRKEEDAVLGRYGEERINNNGERLIELCQSLNLRIMNGFYQHKDIHKYTWEQPKKKLRSIIDYFIQPQNTRLQTNDVRVYRSAECGSDHYMVVANIVIHYRRTSNQNETKDEEVSELKNIKYNIDSLKQESVQFLYKLRLASKITGLNKRETAEAQYQNVKECIQQAAEEALGFKETVQHENPDWWCKEIERVVNDKKKAYQTWLTTKDIEDRKVYIRLNRETKRLVTKRKNEMWEQKCEEVERYLGGTRVSQAWKFIKNLRKERKDEGNINLIQNKKWEEHYKTLLTENRPRFLEELEGTTKVENIDVHEINKEEIRKELKEMKNGKASGPGNIPIELVKYGTDSLLEALAEIFNKCLIEGQDIPREWNVAYISSIYKKGDRKECGNYRGISVTSSVGRLYGRILKKRIEAQYMEIEEQGGFRAGRSCNDNIFTLQQLIEKRTARNLSTHLVFIDLEKAYDTVPLKLLFKVLTRTDLSKTYIRALQNMYKNPQSRVKTGNTLSKPFNVTKGLKQGCCLSPTLFKIYIQEALCKWRQKCSGMGIKINDHCLTTLFFADDQVIMASCEEDADYMLRKLHEEYEKWGMSMNMTKTEYMRVGEGDEDQDLELRKIKKCEEYKYLGSLISNKGSSERDIKHKAQQGQRTIHILNALLWSNQISLRTKMTIYTAVVEPILTYGAECWQMTEKTKRKIDCVEMDYLRRACRISRREHIPNNEIRRRTNRIHKTSERIETRQLIWYGHVQRMNENRWPKRALEYIPESRKKRGRPATTWISGIMQTMRDRAIQEDLWRDKRVWRSKCGMRQKL